ncbi:MAG: bifunctional enoyl-CoA hydratase/phosphate acetyltransferase [Candidatus Eremiobacterota bacterium]
MFKTMKELCTKAGLLKPIKIAVSFAHDPELLDTLVKATEINLASFTIIGHKDKMEEYLGEKKSDFKFIHVDDEDEATEKTVELVYNGEVHGIMNGISHPSKFLKAIKEKKKEKGRVNFLSHIGLFEIPGYDRIIFVTDAGINIAPTLSDKVEILENAIKTANKLGLDQPLVAMITPIEKINYKAMPSTVDASIIAKMSSTGQIKNAIVDGPLALDNAISERAARIKGIKSPVAGKADILLLHNIETGNILYKILTYFAKAKVAACVAGADFPIIYLSRTDTSETRLKSIALAKLLY